MEYLNLGSFVSNATGCSIVSCRNRVSVCGIVFCNFIGANSDDLISADSPTQGNSNAATFLAFCPGVVSISQD